MTAANGAQNSGCAGEKSFLRLLVAIIKTAEYPGNYILQKRLAISANHVDQRLTLLPGHNVQRLIQRRHQIIRLCNTKTGAS